MSARSYLMTTSVTTPPCGPSNPAASHGSQSSDTISLGRSSPFFQQRQGRMAHRALHQQQQPSSSWDSQQGTHRASAFTPYSPQPVGAKPSVTAALGALLTQRGDDGGSGSGEEAAVRKLAQLLLSMPHASSQLADLMLALQPGQHKAAQSPLFAVEGSGSSLPACGNKRPLEEASPGSLQQQQQQCLAARAPAGAPVDATLQRLAQLLTEVPGLSDSLAKAMAEALDVQERQQASPEEPPAKRSRLSSSTATAAGISAPVARLVQLGSVPPSRSLMLTPLSAGPFASAPAMVSPWGMGDASSGPTLPLRPVARPAAAWGRFPQQPAPVGRTSPSTEQQLSLRAAQQHLLPPTAAPVLRPARQQLQREQQYAGQAQRSMSTAAARAAVAEAAPSVDRVKQALVLWQYARARQAVQQKLRTQIALLHYRQQQEQEQARSC